MRDDNVQIVRVHNNFFANNKKYVNIAIENCEIDKEKK